MPAAGTGIEYRVSCLEGWLRTFGFHICYLLPKFVVGDYLRHGRAPKKVAAAALASQPALPHRSSSSSSPSMGPLKCGDSRAPASKVLGHRSTLHPPMQANWSFCQGCREDSSCPETGKVAALLFRCQAARCSAASLDVSDSCSGIAQNGRRMMCSQAQARSGSTSWEPSSHCTEREAYMHGA